MPSYQKANHEEEMLEGDEATKLEQKPREKYEEVFDERDEVIELEKKQNYYEVKHNQEAQQKQEMEKQEPLKQDSCFSQKVKQPELQEKPNNLDKVPQKSSRPSYNWLQHVRQHSCQYIRNRVSDVTTKIREKKIMKSDIQNLIGLAKLAEFNPKEYIAIPYTNQLFYIKSLMKYFVPEEHNTIIQIIDAEVKRVVQLIRQSPEKDRIDKYGFVVTKFMKRMIESCKKKNEDKKDPSLM